MSNAEWGAIPRSLANDVSNMIEKKMGTSPGYKPSEWANEINLMGKLPVKTVSGTIANISDGADQVPIKLWNSHVDASVDGVSEVNGVQTGRNLIPFAVDYPNFTQTKNDMTISVLANGKVKFNGTTTANTDFNFYIASTPSDPHLFVKNGTYTFSNIGNASVKMVVSGGSNNGFPYREITNGYYTGAVTDETKPFNYIIFRIASGVTLSDVVIEPMLEIGSTSHAYEPYQTPTTYTASLGRTIYGGTVDIVNGTGTDGYNKITLSSLLTDLNVAQIGTTGVYRIRFSLADAKGAVNSAVFNGLCDYYTPLTANQTYNKNEGISINTSGQCYIYDSRFNTSTSLNDFKTWIDANPVNLCYELATGTDFTFTPITPTPETALGVNNFWADTGDSEVTYRADIDLSLSASNTRSIPVVEEPEER